VQQCASHLLRHLAGVAELDADNKLWAEQVATALRDAAKLVEQANEHGSPVEADALADARWRYDQGVLVGISFNLSRPWPKGNHPGLKLARRLQAKADQVWLFTQNPQVPWTNNACEQAIRGPKRHQNRSGYWQTTITLSAYCRVRSYLVSAANHGIRAIDAIHNALAGRPWLPTPATA
jgi:transposase